MILKVISTNSYYAVRSNLYSLTHPRCIGRCARKLCGYEISPYLQLTFPKMCYQLDYSGRERNDRFSWSSGSVLANCSMLKVRLPSCTAGSYVNFQLGLRHFHNDSIRRQTPGECPKNCQDVPEEGKRKNLFQNFKQMYRDYWYVLVPVHVVTSVVWFGGFYYLVKSGVDIVAILEKLGLSERWSEQLRDSKAGYLAMTFALYKIASPLRYMVTIGGSTFAIKWLRDFGLIKPLRTNDIKNMYNDKKKSLKEKRRKKKEMKEKR